MTEQNLKQIPLTAMFAAFGVILPQFFHLVGLGSTFLPMFIPVILGSMLLTVRFALLLAFTAPLVSWALTGMPPLVPPVLPVLITELVLMAVIISILRVHLKKSFWLAWITAVIADRIALFLLVSMLAPLLGWQHPMFSIALISSGIPGIILQAITIPAAVKLIKFKYPHWYDLNYGE